MVAVHGRWGGAADDDESPDYPAVLVPPNPNGAEAGPLLFSFPVAPETVPAFAPVRRFGRMRALSRGGGVSSPRRGRGGATTRARRSPDR